MRTFLKAVLMKYVADITLRMVSLMSYTGTGGKLHYKLYASSIPIWVYDPKHKVGASYGSYRFIAPGWWSGGAKYAR